MEVVYSFQYLWIGPLTYKSGEKSLAANVVVVDKSNLCSPLAKKYIWFTFTQYLGVLKLMLGSLCVIKFIHLSSKRRNPQESVYKWRTGRCVYVHATVQWNVLYILTWLDSPIDTNKY